MSARRPFGQRLGERSVRIMAMCAHSTEGTTAHSVAEALGVCIKVSAAMLSSLVDGGHIYRGKVSRISTRYFSTSADALNWVARQQPPKWRLDLPGQEAYTQATGQVLRPAQVEMRDGQAVQIGPSINYDPRFQVDPSTRVVGGFASMGIGRYLPEAPHA